MALNKELRRRRILVPHYQGFQSSPWSFFPQTPSPLSLHPQFHTISVVVLKRKNNDVCSFSYNVKLDSASKVNCVVFLFIWKQKNNGIFLGFFKGSAFRPVFFWLVSCLPCFGHALLDKGGGKRRRRKGEKVCWRKKDKGEGGNSCPTKKVKGELMTICWVFIILLLCAWQKNLAAHAKS